MTTSDQRKMIEELRDYAHRMKRYDQEEFEMFVKRVKDDEDLDTVSQKRLRVLYDVYVPEARRNL